MLYSPFHAAMEIMTSRMLINLYKAHRQAENVSLAEATVVQSMQFISPVEGEEGRYSESNTHF